MASISRILEPKLYSCTACTESFDRYPKEQKEIMLRKKQIGKGCFSTGIKTYTIGNIEFLDCPGNYFNTYINYLWELFTHYQNNLLPYEGTLGNQPAKIIEIFDIIQGVVSEYEAKLEKMRKIKDKFNK